VRVLSVGAFYPPHDLGGGYEVTWKSSVEYLRARGDEVRVLASDYGGQDDDVHRELRMWWHDHGFPRLGVRERLAIERHNADVWRRHVGEFSPDVVCWWQFGVLSMSLIERARVAGLPAVGVVGDEWMVWGPRAEGWLRRVRRVDLSGAAEWLFNSDHTRQRSLEAAGPLARTAIAHPGIDPALFAPAPAKDWSWDLLYLGRLDSRKGVHIAVRAMEHLPPEAKLTLVGSGDDEYVAMLKERAGDRNVVFAGGVPRTELRAAYAAADAVLFPVQWDEPWGLVPIEAMSVGRPVIATGTGGGGEYMRDGENVLLMRPKDSPEALAAAVARLAEDPALREKLVEGGRATAAPLTEDAYNDAIRAALLRA
jgi:glycogen synthase